MRITDFTLSNAGDYISLAQNATQDPTLLTWTCNDTARDAYLIEMIDSASNQGYITVSRSPATSSVISWSEILRLNFDGTIILNSAFLSSPSAPAAGQAKVYLADFLERLVAKFQTDTETVNLLQSSGFGRVWVQPDGSFPASGAKVWDVLLKPAADAVDGLRFGEIYVENNSTATSIASATTWYQVTVFDTNGVSNGTTPDHTNDHITIDHDGFYLIEGSAAIKSVSAGAIVIECEVKLNNGATSLLNVHWDRELSGAGGDTGSTSMSGIAYLSTNDTVEMWVQNKTNANDVVFEDITLTVIELK